MTHVSERRWEVRVHRVVVAALAGFDLCFRAIDSLPWRLVPLELAKPSLSLLGWHLARFSSWGELLEWLVLGVILFTFLPAVYRVLLGVTADGYGFRLICTASGLGYAAVLRDPAGIVQLFGEIFSILIVSSAALLGYLHLVYGWRFFDTEGRAAGVLDSFSPDGDMRAELRSDLERGRWSRRFGMAFWLGAVGVVLSFPTFLGGLSITFLEGISPLVDLVLIGWIVYALRSDEHEIDASVPFDLEARLSRAIADATRNMKGVMVVLFSTAGLWFAVFPIPLAITMLGEFVPSFLTIGRADPLFAWNFVGVVVLLFAVGLSLSWVWLRELDRISVFLDRWEGRDSVFGGPNRPVGLTLPPMAALWCAGLYLAIRDYSTLARWLFAGGWPLVLAGLGGVVWWTDERPLRFPTHEDWAIVGGLLVQSWGIWLLSEIEFLVESSPADTLALLIGPDVVFPLLGLPAAAFLPDVGRYASDHEDDLGRYANAVYVLGVGIVCAAIAQLGGTVAPGLEIAAGFCLIMGLLLAVVKYVEHH